MLTFEHDTEPMMTTPWLIACAVMVAVALVLGGLLRGAWRDMKAAEKLLKDVDPSKIKPYKEDD